MIVHVMFIFCLSLFPLSISVLYIMAMILYCTAVPVEKHSESMRINRLKAVEEKDHMVHL